MSSLLEWSWSIINGAPSISVITPLSFSFQFLPSSSAATWRKKDSPFLYSPHVALNSLSLPYSVLWLFTSCPFPYIAFAFSYPFLSSAIFHLPLFFLSFPHISLPFFIPSFTSLPVIFPFLRLQITPFLFVLLFCYTSIPFLSSSHISLLFLTCPTHTTSFLCLFFPVLPLIPPFPFLSSHFLFFIPLISLPFRSSNHISLIFLTFLHVLLPLIRPNLISSFL